MNESRLPAAVFAATTSAPKELIEDWIMTLEILKITD